MDGPVILNLIVIIEIIICIEECGVLKNPVYRNIHFVITGNGNNPWDQRLKRRTSYSGCSDIGKLCQENFGIKQVKFFESNKRAGLVFFFITTYF